MKIDRGSDAWQDFTAERRTIRIKYYRMLAVSRKRYRACLKHDRAHSYEYSVSTELAVQVIEVTYKDARRGICRKYRKELRVVRDFHLA